MLFCTHFLSYRISSIQWKKFHIYKNLQKSLGSRGGYHRERSTSFSMWGILSYFPHIEQKKEYYHPLTHQSVIIEREIKVDKNCNVHYLN